MYNTTHGLNKAGLEEHFLGIFLYAFIEIDGLSRKYEK